MVAVTAKSSAYILLLKIALWLASLVGGASIASVVENNLIVVLRTVVVLWSSHVNGHRLFTYNVVFVCDVFEGNNGGYHICVRRPGTWAMHIVFACYMLLLNKSIIKWWNRVYYNSVLFVAAQSHKRCHFVFVYESFVWFVTTRFRTCNVGPCFEAGCGKWEGLCQVSQKLIKFPYFTKRNLNCVIGWKFAVDLL